MTETEFRQELKSLHGGYLFFGSEDYLKFSYSKEVYKSVFGDANGTFDEFNHIVIYGEDYSPQNLSGAIATLPMMCDKKLVEVRGVNFNAFKKDDIADFENVLASLSNYGHTILLIRADSSNFDEGRLPKRPSELYKTVSQYITPVQFDFPQPQRLRSWILRHFADGKINFDVALCDYLVEICGHSMWTLSNEISKLCAYALYNSLSVLTKADIDAVCCKTTEYDDFQLTNALLEGTKEFVFETLHRQKLNHEPANALLYSITKTYTELYAVSRLYSSGLNKTEISQKLKIHEFKVGKYLAKISKSSPARIRRSLELCSEADIKLKSSSNVTPYIAVERLVSTLCAL